MAKRRAKSEENGEPNADGVRNVVIEDIGPIDRVVIPFRPGHVTLLTGSNGAGKSESLAAINALAGRGTEGLSVRDGQEDGRISGFGCAVKLTLRQSRRTGEIDVLVIEEGFSLASFVRPGFKDAKANDKRRLKDLASVLGISIKPEACHELVGGVSVYRSIVSEKTIRAVDPADFVSCLKADLDYAALEREKDAKGLEGEADGMEATLPDIDQTAETDAEVLTDRLTQASNAKQALVQKVNSAAEMRKLAESARAVLAAGQGETVEAALTAKNAAVNELAEAGLMLTELRQAVAEQIVRVDSMKQKAMDCGDRVDQASKRAQELAAASERLSAQLVVPTDEELAQAEAVIKAAEDALLLGGRLRQADETRDLVDQKRSSAAAAVKEAERFRGAAQATLGLLVEPINQMGVGISIEDRGGDLRIVCDHPARGKCFVEELSPGEGWSLAIRLMTKMHGSSEIPAIVAIPQECFEGLDFQNRKLFLEAVAETKLMVVTAMASQDESDERVPVEAVLL